MIPRLPPLLRIRMKVICCWCIIRGYGVIYRMDLNGEGHLKLKANTEQNICYIAESNILNGVTL